MQSARRHPAPTDTGLARFDAQGALTPSRLLLLRGLFDDTGALHVTNTGLADRAALQALMAALGFGAGDQFSAGGRTAAAWQTKWAAPGLRQLDFYPQHLYLLPNGEIHYQRDFPERILFFCETPPAAGGRTFIHAAKKLESALVVAGRMGRALLDKIRTHGLMIEVGFLDRNHPQKAQNYFQSWQERFGHDDRGVALHVAQSRSREYDSCWWAEDAGYPVLMTRITLPGFVDKDGVDYMRFPRIAMDGPLLRNGFRRYPLGNGVELSEAEKDLLKSAYLATREGYRWAQGDLILMDNIRHAHSREAFAGPRDIFIGMAGLKKL